MERWLQLMLMWSPQKRGKDPNATPSNCFSQLELILKLKLVHILNMISAKILTYSVADDETVADLQLRLERDTGIPCSQPGAAAGGGACPGATRPGFTMRRGLRGGGRTAERPSSGLLV
ncbi:Inhibitor of nuclear factor kappa-B kinase subunit beta [Oryzias melastigma]|uniref:Inhibitor of nuclear factor kappa-B kinase subunit beta n=1 Tax=Oryzias melastigma TaxID=30732 RepID=A0A834CNP8_ORYME|nr:Inhibitor of nuclear factor kappa-B kinase subunit beta [Oryzias melastigma]